MKIKDMKKLLGNKFFTVTFTKKDGSLRKMNARLGVTKHLKGGTKRYDAEARNMLTVFDVTKGAYRTVKVDNIKQIKAKGVNIDFR